MQEMKEKQEKEKLEYEKQEQEKYESKKQGKEKYEYECVVEVGEVGVGFVGVIEVEVGEEGKKMGEGEV